MSSWPKDNNAALNAFYGGPPAATAKWEVTNLVSVTPPWRIYKAGTTIELLRGIRVNKACAASLILIFNDLWEYCGKSQSEIEKYDLHKIGGGYTPRMRRGGTRPSTHFYGAAIDIDPLDNAMRKGNRGDMAAFVILTFQRHGWRWGGEYGDPMHFEACYSATSDAIAKAWALKPVLPQPVKVVTAPKPAAKWVIPQAAIDIIKFEEGLELKAYNDRGSWAIGYGHTSKVGAPVVTEGMTITAAQAEAILAHDINTVVGSFMPLIKVRLTPNQLGGLTPFVYNIGQANFAASTMLRTINAGDFVGAAAEFPKWNKSTNAKTKQKEDLPGLTRRRGKERAQFETL